MTVPGGVPNLPTGALTIDTLASATQDTSPEAMKSRAVDRFAPIFNSSTGGSPANDLTPYGVIVKLFAFFNSLVANADPADIQGPEDLPQLLVNFVESLPLVGQFVDLNDAVLGNYEGDDETLLAIQAFFVGIRADVAQAQADADAAADKWAQSVDQLFGAGHDIGDFINLLQGLRDGKVSVLAPQGSNQLDNPSFDGEISIEDPSHDFAWDNTVYRTASKTLALSGSARADATGELKEIRSNLVGVSAGQIWTFVANIATVALAGTGTLVQLTAQPYDAAGNELTPVVLVSSGVPVGSAIWVKPPTGTYKTAQLLADWTVPEGVTRVSLRVVLTENATAGSLHLDDMNLSAKSLIPQFWVKDLVDNITGFFTWLTQLGQITNGEVVTAYNASVQQFKDWWNGLLGPAAVKARADQNTAWATRKQQNDAILNDWFSGTYALGSPSDTAATRVGGKPTKWGAWNDNWTILGEQTGVIPVTTPLVDIGTFAQETKTRVITAEDTIATVQAAVDALSVDDTTIAGRKFVSSASGGAGTWGALWSVAATNGNIAPKATLDLFDMTLAASSSINLKLTGRFTGGELLTDNGVLSVIFQDAAKAMFGGVGPTNTFKYRMSADGLNYGYMRVNANSVQIGYAVGGVEQTPWATAAGLTVPAGAKVEVYYGNPTNARQYLVRVNGSVVIPTYTEVGTSSMLGAGYRGGGMDMLATHGVSNDTWPPAKVKQFTLRDASSSSVTYGTSARWYRATTNGILVNKNGVQGLGSLVYDTPEYKSPDLELVVNGIAIYTPGRYRITHAAKVSSDVTAPWTWTAIPAGTAYASVNQITWPGPVVISKASSKAEAAAVLGLGASFSFNAVGDGGVTELWAPSIAVVGTAGTQYSVLGDGSGEGTWLQIDRIG